MICTVPVICPAKYIHFITDTMALFNWFTKKSGSNAAALPSGASQKAQRSHAAAPFAQTSFTPPTPSAPLHPPAGPTSRSEERKAKRHTRREQLYSAIRQAMTRCGVLSASFKFKVLSLDQTGDQFLVMMDILPSLGWHEEKLLQSEALVMQIAKAQFGMLVSAVYWRIDTQAGLDDARKKSGPSKPDAMPLARKPSAPRFEPVDDGEVSAFHRALAASAAQVAPSASAGAKTLSTRAAAASSAAALAIANSATIDSAAKSRSGVHSYTLLTGFEDTEMPELADLPALSATQYGDLH